MGKIKIVRFAVIDDVKKNSAKFESLNANATSLYNQTFLKFQDALNVLIETEKLIDDSLIKLKDLGVDDKMFSSAKTQLITEKNRIQNILKKLN